MICPRYFFGFSLAHLFNFPRRLFCPIQHTTHCYRVFFHLVSELIGSLWLRLNKGLPSLNILVYLVCYVIIVLVSPFFLHSSNIQALVRLGERLARQAEQAGRSHSKSALISMQGMLLLWDSRSEEWQFSLIRLPPLITGFCFLSFKILAKYYTFLISKPDFLSSKYDLFISTPSYILGNFSLPASLLVLQQENVLSGL